MSRYGDLDYPTLAKGGFLLGLALFVIGAGGELLGSTLLGPLPGWEDTLLLDLEMAGLVIGFLSPFVFGIFLPLTEGQ